MPLSLYNSTVQSYIQTISAILTCLDKGRKFCADNDIDRNQFVDARLYEDMLPLHFQVITLVHFSEGAVLAADRGVLAGPDMTLAFDYDGLQNYLEGSLRRLSGFDSKKIENDANN